MIKKLYSLTFLLVVMSFNSRAEVGEVNDEKVTLNFESSSGIVGKKKLPLGYNLCNSGASNFRRAEKLIRIKSASRKRCSLNGMQVCNKIIMKEKGYLCLLDNQKNIHFDNNGIFQSKVMSTSINSSDIGESDSPHRIDFGSCVFKVSTKGSSYKSSIVPFKIEKNLVISTPVQLKEKSNPFYNPENDKVEDLNCSSIKISNGYLTCVRNKCNIGGAYDRRVGETYDKYIERIKKHRNGLTTLWKHEESMDKCKSMNKQIKTRALPISKFCEVTKASSSSVSRGNENKKVLDNSRDHGKLLENGPKELDGSGSEADSKTK